MNAKTYPEPAKIGRQRTLCSLNQRGKTSLSPGAKPHSNLSACNAQAALQRGKLENFICAEFIEHDIIFLSELLRNMSINIECSCCTSILEQLMAIRRSLKKELAFFSKKVGGKGVANADSD